MNSMIIIGSIIFALYITGLLLIVTKGHNEQERDMMNDPEIPESFKHKY
jgi:hypothetical protein